MDIFNEHFNVASILSWWGAILSSILAILKIREDWNNRFQVDVSTIFRSSADVGHELSIKNLSAKPILLEYMELFTKEKKLFAKEKNIFSLEDSWLNDRIEPSDAKSYHFREGNYFGWRIQPIYIRLYFAGRKPIIKKIR